jgi:hypothetical protein
MLGLEEPALNRWNYNRLPSTYQPTNDERSLDWIHAMGAKTIRRLIEHGRADDLVLKLNLTYYHIETLKAALSNVLESEEMRQQAR